MGADSLRITGAMNNKTLSSKSLRQPSANLRSGDFSLIVINSCFGARYSYVAIIGYRSGSRNDVMWDQLTEGHVRAWKFAFAPDDPTILRQRFLDGQMDICAYTIFDGEQRVSLDHTTNTDLKPLTYKMVKRLAKGMY